MTLAEEMIAYRAKHKLSQSALAKKVGIDRAAVLYIESGKRTARKTTEYLIREVINKEE